MGTLARNRLIGLIFTDYRFQSKLLWRKWPVHKVKIYKTKVKHCKKRYLASSILVPNSTQEKNIRMLLYTLGL